MDINRETGWETAELCADAYGTRPGGSQKSLKVGQNLLETGFPCLNKCGQVLATDD